MYWYSVCSVIDAFFKLRYMYEAKFVHDGYAVWSVGEMYEWMCCIYCSGQMPAEADFNLLDTARKVEVYGIRMHQAKVCHL